MRTTESTEETIKLEARIHRQLPNTIGRESNKIKVKYKNK